MNVSVTIYKEKKEKDFRMVILPSGRNKIGLGQYKDYGIISYLNKKDSKKIGELIYWALNESDNEEIEDEEDGEIAKEDLDTETEDEKEEEVEEESSEDTSGYQALASLLMSDTDEYEDVEDDTDEE